MRLRLFIATFFVLGIWTFWMAGHALAANYSWVPATQGSCDTICKNLGKMAVYGGFDGVVKSSLYVCGVDTQNFAKGKQSASGYIPGKNVSTTGTCTVPFKGREFSNKTFVCLCLP